MRAIVIHRPGPASSLAVEDVAMPSLRARDVLIRVDTCGVCFHDVVIRNGTMSRGVGWPLIPGHEVAGIVEAVGPQAVEFKKGDRVASVQSRHVCGTCRFCRTDRQGFCHDREVLGDAGLNGGYAEFVAIEEDNLTHVPASVSLEQAAIVGCVVGTELNAIRDVAKVQLGERVLVTGAGGGVGIHGVQVARGAGAEVIAVTTSPEKVDDLYAVGAHHVVCHEKGSDFSAGVLSVAPGGVDVAIDNVGSVAFNATRKSMAMGGRWILVGQLNGDFIRFNPAQLFHKGISLLSARSTTRRQLADSLELVRRGQVKPIISKRLPLEAAAQAHAMLESGKVTGRIVLKLKGGEC